jgi:hypothetical protein
MRGQKERNAPNRSRKATTGSFWFLADSSEFIDHPLQRASRARRRAGELPWLLASYRRPVPATRGGNADQRSRPFCRLNHNAG